VSKHCWCPTPTVHGSMATLTSASHPKQTQRFLFLGQKRTRAGAYSTSVFDPYVWSGRALQVVSPSWRRAVLHQCIRPLIGAFAPGHHGYQRACDLVSGQASTGHLRHQCTHALGRPNLHLVSSSRRPRLETVDSVMSSLSPHIARFLCSSPKAVPSSRPAELARVARRGGQGRPSRLACGQIRRCQAAP
jgi:hypothetical protein